MPALGKLKQKNQEFKDTLSYMRLSQTDRRDDLVTYLCTAIPVTQKQENPLIAGV